VEGIQWYFIQDILSWLNLIFILLHGSYVPNYLLPDIFHLFHEISIQKGSSTVADEDEEGEEDIDFDDDFEGKFSSSSKSLVI
jgi:hypothetical protein